ncbi:hypothetical protein Ddye_021351 [Dipteronia dyeriana]|uniref:Uncharacterized protein n=1 Tax=Dipteronia dyeriana TaxID=168575 RepID=A0AAD9WWT6_9ROSI|nr:hypothetical protein Ddye_021351 [Dipteronia dyeriana]
MIQDSDDSGTLSESTDYTDPDSHLEAYQATSNGSTCPQVQVQVLTTKYSRPAPIIAYFDTRAHSSMMNPKVLPLESWKEERNEFLAADGKIFVTNLISKHKIGIQFFPSFSLRTHVIGTPLPDKDILIGWDIYSQSRPIRILPTGIRF